jgi:Methyltransferase domain
MFGDIAEYDALLREHAGVPLTEARVFEIGFGARPHRQVALQSMGVDARGIDAEVPLLGGRPREIGRIVRRNGVERALKSVVRRTLFDCGERRELDRALRERGWARRLDTARLLVGDAGEARLEPGSLDLVFSEDVFEHIDRRTLEGLIPRMATWLRPRGLALIRPNVFPGITGGHLLDWSPFALRHPPARRRGEPWEHLRRRRFAPNTHLNALTRADYRTLLGGPFEILEERVAEPGLGREHYHGSVRAELAGWPAEELFSNRTLFVLRPRAS